MSYGKLNIWLRFEDCSLINTCWRTDLVIKTCTGKYLVDMYPALIPELQKNTRTWILSRIKIIMEATG
jgi:hypothetical protein